MMHFLQNRSRRLPMLAAIVSGATLAAAALLAFGPLTPPSGAVTGTAKPLSEIEPRTAINAVNTPGNASTSFIITQPGSYYLTGNLTGEVSKTGISIQATNVSIDLNGFTLQGVSGSNWGIVFSGATSVGGSVHNGVIRDWGSSGITGGPAQAIFRDLRIINCGGFGLHLGDRSVATRIVIFGSLLNAIASSNGCRITDCCVTNCDSGISAASGSVVTGCSVFGSTTYGIVAVNSVVQGCTVTNCTTNGIQASLGCTVIGNTLATNGAGAGDGANIFCSSSDNRVEGNNCIGADRGIHCSSPGNFIVRNTCSGNSINWVFVANNVYGPIIDRSAPASAAVNGNTAASSLSSTDPNANFTY